MTATNHTITGVLVAAALPHPLVAVPFALASHLLLDALPHFGTDGWQTSRGYKILLAIDAIGASTIILLVYLFAPAHWPLLLACGVIAAAPDVIWLSYWLDELKERPKPLGPIAHWLGWIQWGAVSWGWVFEIAYLMPAVWLFSRVLVGY